jgi:bifunctional DNase/RNase
MYYSLVHSILETGTLMVSEVEVSSKQAKVYTGKIP